MFYKSQVSFKSCPQVPRQISSKKRQVRVKSSHASFKLSSKSGTSFFFKTTSQLFNYK